MKEIYAKVDYLLGMGKKRKFFLFLLMLMTGAFEALGTASIMPFIMVASKPQTIMSNTFLAYIFSLGQFENVNSFVIFLGVSAILTVVTSLIFRACTIYVISKFIHLSTYKVSTKLMEIYLSRPYAWFLNRHTANMGRMLLSEVHHVTTKTVMPALHIISDLTISTFLLLLIIIVHPAAALTASLFIGGGYITAYRFLSKKLFKAGKERAASQEACFKIAQETLGGIKEIKVFGLEKTQASYLNNPAKILALKHAKIDILSGLPFFVLQSIAFTGIVLFLLTLIVVNQKDMTATLPILAIYAFAGIRLIPACQRIFSSLANIKAGKQTLDHLYEDFILKEEVFFEDVTKREGLQSVKCSNVLELRHVDFTYPRSEQPVLHDLNLKIFSNTKVGFVGGTGSGKTTAADIIMGLLDPEKGGIYVDGNLLSKAGKQGWQRNIGYVPQHIFLIDDTIAANIAFGIPADNIDYEAVRSASRIADLDNFINGHMKDGYHTKIGEKGVRLSGGQRQRIGIARALYRNPDILILDEATSALDNKTEKNIMEAIKSLDKAKTIILIAHRLNTIKDCDTVFFFKDGRIKHKGTYEELLLNEDFNVMATGIV